MAAQLCFLKFECIQPPGAFLIRYLFFFFPGSTANCSQEKLEAQRIQSYTIRADRDKDCESGCAGLGGLGATVLRQVQPCSVWRIYERQTPSNVRSVCLPETVKTHYSRAPALPQGSVWISLHYTQVLPSLTRQVGPGLYNMSVTGAWKHHLCQQSQ